MYIIMYYGLNLTGKESDSKIQESLSGLKSTKKSFNGKFYNFLENSGMEINERCFFFFFLSAHTQMEIKQNTEIRQISNL